MGAMTSTPQRYGAALSVPTVAALAALDVGGMTAGTEACVTGTNDKYRLIVGGSGTAATGVSGAAWVRQAGSPSIRSFTGADATEDPVSVTLTGAVVGQAVAGVLVASTGVDVTADFETTISVVDKIQQLDGDHQVALITILS